MGLIAATGLSACEDEKGADTGAAPAAPTVSAVEPDGQEFTEEAAVTTPTTPAADSNECVALSASICLRTPPADAAISSPLVMEGEAAGWYFEGEFPARLVDGNGSDIAWASAWAQGDWMTTDPVPFKATFTFTAPATTTGKLILTRSDPRGAGAAETVEIPVRFAP